MDDHSSLILAGQMGEGDVGDLVDHVLPQRVVERAVCRETQDKWFTHHQQVLMP